MASTKSESDEAEKVAADILAAKGDKEAILYAFQGLANLALAILYEIREVNEAVLDSA